jgi:hypothetical protein
VQDPVTAARATPRAAAHTCPVLDGCLFPRAARRSMAIQMTGGAERIVLGECHPDTMKASAHSVRSLLAHLLAHSPAHMGTKRQQPFKGPLTEGNTASKQQKLLVAAGLCRDCGGPRAGGRAKTICDKCADQAAAATAAAAAADKAAERKEAEKNSPLLSARELKALPQLPQR